MVGEFDIITDHKNLEYFTTTKVLNQRQVRWSEFLSRFNFRITYRPGAKATVPDALSRKWEDCPVKADTDNDNRLRNRHRTLLLDTKFDPQILTELRINSNPSTSPTAAGIDLIIPDLDKPIDDLIDRAYQNCPITNQMLSALTTSRAKYWPRDIRKHLRIAIQDCEVHAGRIYYREKLFIPPVDELKL
jgi:hypothetical protein